MVLRDLMVNQVMLATVDPQESRDNVEWRAREASRETKDTPELTDQKYVHNMHDN